ncbi:Detoxification-like protein [Thalictrum thalictroides]|uniref:Detoxification-like protein n=1 Tax=Thalictrum thalictroides TaxID=46969 RepID=A0A7J6V348_THATH|nr:Detoxification-like protein [Thalictrum thalictroides]
MIEGGLVHNYWVESKKMWSIAAPAIITSVTQFSIAFVTVAYVGHLGEVELAAVSIVQAVIDTFAFGIMLGMASAMETLCGQAVGAGQLNMLGIYMQRSWIITAVTALILTPICLFFTHTKVHSPKQKYIRTCWEVLNLGYPSIICICPKLPDTKVLPISEQSLGHDIDFGGCIGHTCFVELDTTDEARAWNDCCCNSREHLILAYKSFCIVSGYFPGAWTGFSTLAFKSLICLCEAFTFLSSNVMLGDVVLHSIDSSSGKFEKSRNCSRRYFSWVSFIFYLCMLHIVKQQA